MDFFTSIAGVVAAGVTALATVFLWVATRTLVTETRRMVEASSRPHVVATIEPNRWSLMYADIRVTNSGTGTAYDIDVAFDPPLSVEGKDHAPLAHISVLRPGQTLASYLSRIGPLMDVVHTVTVSWRRDPQPTSARETNQYTISLRDLKGFEILGATEPLMQVAQEMKHLREDWKNVASGFSRLRVETFTAHDRQREQEDYAKLADERQAARDVQRDANRATDA